MKAKQIFYTCRLLLLFEYLIHNLYEPPKELLEQVTHNIFRRFRGDTASNDNANNANINSSSPPPPSASLLTASPKYYSCNVIDGLVRLRNISAELRHAFYNLHNAPDLPSAPHEVPKLDGLALSFLLGASDVVCYRQIYGSLVSLLQVLHQADLNRDCDEPLPAMSATQYCFSVAWRVLQSLPPSLEFLETLLQTESNSVEKPLCTMLHGVLLAPRVAHKYVRFFFFTFP